MLPSTNTNLSLHGMFCRRAAPDPPGSAPILALEQLSAESEQRLLRDPWRNAAGARCRPCLRGGLCVGRLQDLPGGHGRTLVEFMTDAELERFESTGDPPTQRRMCVLCIRRDVTGAYDGARGQAWPANWVLNPWVDPHGPEEALDAGSGVAWRGIWGRFQRFYLNDFVTKIDADGGWSVPRTCDVVAEAPKGFVPVLKRKR